MQALLTRTVLCGTLLILAAQATLTRADFMITGPAAVIVGQNQSFGVTFTLTNTGTTTLTPGGTPGTSANPNSGLGSMNYIPVTVASTEPTLPTLAVGAVMTYTFSLLSGSLQNGETAHIVFFNITPYYIDSGSGNTVSHASPQVTITVTSATVPEPASLALSGLGLAGTLGLAWSRNRRRAQAAIAA